MAHLNSFHFFFFFFMFYSNLKENKNMLIKIVEDSMNNLFILL